MPKLKKLALKNTKKQTTVAAKQNNSNNLVGTGFVIANVQSPITAALIINSSALMRKLSDQVNSDIFRYEFIDIIKKDGSISMDLASIISMDDNELLTLGVYGSAELRLALTAAKALRVEVLENIVAKDEIVELPLLAEVLNHFKGKNIILTVENKKRLVKINSAKFVRGWGGASVEVNFNTSYWNGTGICESQENASIKDPGIFQPHLGSYGIKINLTDEEKETFFSRGKKILDLCKNCKYVQVNGNMEVKYWWFWRPIPATGRAIVDPVGYQIFNPNEHVYRHNNNNLVVSPDVASKELLSLLDPNIICFSFVNKQWGRVNVDDISDINFRGDAFDKLVMPDSDKELVMSLVKNADSGMVSDIVDNKGGGCVLLLHGKPGLGKTLTAEAVAEVLKRPLYAVSIGELGVSPDKLEEKLLVVLQTAQRWNAVLLLDEADVFLESRQTGDINRNAMVGTFLRLLEYYNGVLILTTNRVKDIDTAFYSRISLAFKYDDFTNDSRTQVVRNLLHTNNVELSEEDLMQIAALNCNGRQIKNAIRISRYLAKDQNRKIHSGDIKRVLDKLSLFQADLSQKVN